MFRRRQQKCPFDGRAPIVVVSVDSGIRAKLLTHRILLFDPEVDVSQSAMAKRHLEFWVS